VRNGSRNSRFFFPTQKGAGISQLALSILKVRVRLLLFLLFLYLRSLTRCAAFRAVLLVFCPIGLLSLQVSFSGWHSIFLFFFELLVNLIHVLGTLSPLVFPVGWFTYLFPLGCIALGVGWPVFGPPLPRPQLESKADPLLFWIPFLERYPLIPPLFFCHRGCVGLEAIGETSAPRFCQLVLSLETFLLVNVIEQCTRAFSPFLCFPFLSACTPVLFNANNTSFCPPFSRSARVLFLCRLFRAVFSNPTPKLVAMIKESLIVMPPA